MVNIAKVTVDPSKVEDYKSILKEEMETSLRLEADVYVLYAVSDNAHHNEFTILEVYKDQESYDRHCRMPQMQKSIFITGFGWSIIICGNALLNPTGEDRYNNRTEYFSMAKEGVRLTPFNHNWINPIATVSANYKLTRHFGLNAEYLFNRQRPRLENFGGQDYPSLDPVDVLHVQSMG